MKPLVQFRRALCALAVSLVALSASAATVQVSAQFQSFTGVVSGSGSGLTTFIDSGAGPKVFCPDSGCATNSGTATSVPLDLGSGVEFWSSFLGTDNLHNAIVFTSSGPQSAVFGQEFLLGHITFTNGIWFTDPEFAVTLTVASSDPAYNGLSWSDVIHLGITPNSASNTPYQNADFIYFTLHPSLGSGRAFELFDSPTGSNTVSFDVYGMLNSLDPTRFANAAGGGFLDPSVTTQPTVPEPPVLSLLLASGGGLARLARRRAR